MSCFVCLCVCVGQTQGSPKWALKLHYNRPSVLFTLSNSPQFKSVRTRWQQVSVPWWQLFALQTGRVPTSVLASSQREGCWGEGRQPQRKEENVRRERDEAGWHLNSSVLPPDRVEQKRGSSLSRRPPPSDTRQLPLKLLPLTTPSPSPESCGSCPGSSWCAAPWAGPRGSGTNTPSWVWPGQRESDGGRHRETDREEEEGIHAVTHPHSTIMWLQVFWVLATATSLALGTNHLSIYHLAVTAVISTRLTGNGTTAAAAAAACVWCGREDVWWLTCPDLFYWNFNSLRPSRLCDLMSFILYLSSILCVQLRFGHLYWKLHHVDNKSILDPRSCLHNIHVLEWKRLYCELLTGFQSHMRAWEGINELICILLSISKYNVLEPRLIKSNVFFFFQTTKHLLNCETRRSSEFSHSRIWMESNVWYLCSKTWLLSSGYQDISLIIADI